MNKSNPNVDQLRNILSESTLPQVSYYKMLLDTVETREKGSTFKILLAGEKNRGKSALINALIGQDILRSSLTSNGAIYHLTYAESASTEVIMPDGNRQILDTLDEVAQIDADEEEGPYPDVVIRLPADILRKGIEFVEYPTLNIEGENTLLPIFYDADLLIFVLSCEALLTAQEASLIQRISNLGGYSQIFVVANRIDRVPANERETFLEVSKRRLLPYVTDEAHLYFVSAIEPNDSLEKLKNALEAASAEPRNVDDRMAVITQHIAQSLLPTMSPVLEQAQVEQQAAQDKASIFESLINKQQLISKHIIEPSINRTGNLLTGRTTDFINHLVIKISDELSKQPLSNEDKLRILTTPRAAQKLVTDLATEIIAQTRTQIQNWQRNDLLPYVEQRWNELKKDISNDLGSFIQEAELLKITKIPSVDSLMALMTFDAAFVVNGPSDLPEFSLRNSINGKDETSNSGMLIAVTVAAAAIGLASFFWLGAGLLVSVPVAAIPLLLFTNQMIGTNVEKAKTVVEAHVRTNTLEMASQYSKVIASQYGKMVNQAYKPIDDALTAFIQSLESSDKDVKSDTQAYIKSLKNTVETLKKIVQDIS